MCLRSLGQSSDALFDPVMELVAAGLADLYHGPRKCQVCQEHRELGAGSPPGALRHCPWVVILSLVIWLGSGWIS